MIDRILNQFRTFEGDVALYYRPLNQGEAFCFNEDQPLIAASVIKLPIMIEAFHRFENGTLSPNAPVTIRSEDKMPSCGALSYMHDGLTVSVLDLVSLMIILSDNTATNLMIDLLGIESINRTLASLGAVSTRLNRKLFDAQAMENGLNNYITAREIGMIFEKLYCGEIVSPAASEKMLEILSCQQLNGKIPFFLEEQGVKIAHKTGEDDAMTHDAGIVYADTPFVLVALSNHVNVPGFQRLIQDTARDFFTLNVTKVLQR